MAKTKEQIKNEITLGVSQQAINLLIENLAEAHVKIEELNARIAELDGSSSKKE